MQCEKVYKEGLCNGHAKMIDLLSFVVVVAVRLIDPVTIVIALAIGAIATIPKDRSVQWVVIGIGAVAMTGTLEMLTVLLRHYDGQIGDARAPMRIMTTLTASGLQIAFATWLFKWWRHRGSASEQQRTAPTKQPPQ